MALLFFKLHIPFENIVESMVVDAVGQRKKKVERYPAFTTSMMAVLKISKLISVSYMLFVFSWGISIFAAGLPITQRPDSGSQHAIML